MIEGKNYYNSENYSLNGSNKYKGSYYELDSSIFKGNLLKNPSFENGLEFWTSNNARTSNDTPAEGTQVPILASGVASITHDVPINKQNPYPLLLSLILYNGEVGTPIIGLGNLVVQILWLDKQYNVIASGLRGFISSRALNNNGRTTYYDITDTPPPEAAYARFLLSKGDGSVAINLMAIDNIILTPVKTANLLQNPSFENGLTGWTANGFNTGFSVMLEGAAAAESNGEGSLSQDIPLNNFLRRSPFLLSFAVISNLTSSLNVRLLWLDSNNNQIGLPGLDFTIQPATLSLQANLLSYLDISNSAPIEAVKVRVLFSTTASTTPGRLIIDHVLLAAVITDNLIENYSFETGLSLNNWSVINTLPFVTDRAYSGNVAAIISQEGGVLYQDVSLPSSSENSYLLNFGLLYFGGRFPNGDLIAKVSWLNEENKEIGLGLSIIVPLYIFQLNAWLVYSGITETAPRSATKARIQFTKSSGGTGGSIAVDRVVFARLI